MLEHKVSAMFILIGIYNFGVVPNVSSLVTQLLFIFCPSTMSQSKQSMSHQDTIIHM